MWCKLLATRSEGDGSIVPVYKAGLHFENADSEAVKGLGRYIQDQAAPGENTQLEARIKLDKLARILVGDELEFMVTKISKGGMEAEMSHQPRIDSILDLELSLGGEHVEVRGRVVNTAHKNGGDECFIVGIEFLAPSEQAAQRLDAFISTLTAAGH